VFDTRADEPIAVLFMPVFEPAKALAPTAVLVATAPAPRPIVRPWITAPAVSVETPVTPRVVDAASEVKEVDDEFILLRGIIFSQRICYYLLFITSISVQGRGGTQN
jgi:hypothetical protein